MHTYSGSQWPAIDYDPIQRMLSKHDNFRVIGWAHTCAMSPAVVLPNDQVFQRHMQILEKDFVAVTIDAQQLLSAWRLRNPDAADLAEEPVEVSRISAA